MKQLLSRPVHGDLSKSRASSMRRLLQREPREGGFAGIEVDLLECSKLHSRDVGFDAFLTRVNTIGTVN